ncbi:vanadium-dependent haloperoxidase [Glaciecola sp. XM2]|uniref:vanadium-dependent haloperoxidase n=1 Tax=Glaciecola sp. XM2 TaxID=1914931 RepID=UPI001BDE3030|nr:vanadium-dependent haloperoxidase [Glaciecola sp. XM2]MBT1451473.1 vanadium-dependent haloperoxidase [Glaciecola sp. XM2]
MPAQVQDNASNAKAEVANEVRAFLAFKLRSDAALQSMLEPLPKHPHSDDEIALDNYINSYTKGLPHDAFGLVDASAYQQYLHALSTGKSADFEKIPKGDPDGLGLRNPLAAYSFVMKGKDPHALSMPEAPDFSSQWQAAEATEVLWKAIVRDVPFSDYAQDEDIRQGVDDLNKLSDFRGPTHNGKITTQTLFRGVGKSETSGPYISQFLLMPVPFGATLVEQKYDVPISGNDHMTNYDEWLHIQNGGKPSGITVFTPEKEPRYLFNGRALAQYVLKDFVNMAYVNAAQIMAGFGPQAYSKTNPYNTLSVQARSPLFGSNHAIDLLSSMSMASQKVAWYQKWLVHRRARPEVFYGRVHNHLTLEDISYPIHQEALESSALNTVFNRNATYLLPMAGPEGSPLHPTYPAGHAVMAGAAVTILKAFFDGDFPIPNPVMTDSEGMTLVPYTGETLTIESELNKLASNISLGRNFAGVHYRSDGDLGIVLGEEYAISVLKELVDTYGEDFEGFRFNRFDGTAIVID